MTSLRCLFVAALLLAAFAEAEAQVTVVVCPIDDPECVTATTGPRIMIDAGGNGSDAGSQFDAANNLDFGNNQVDAGDGGPFVTPDAGPGSANIPPVSVGNGISPTIGDDQNEPGCQLVGRGPSGPLFPALVFGMVMAWYVARTRRR